MATILRSKLLSSGSVSGPEAGIRATILAAGAIGGSLLITQFALPGTDEGGTPTAILFQGLVFGVLNALTAVGIVVIYRSHRIINFAQAALGVAGGVFTANLMLLLNWNYFLALTAGVAVAAALGLIFQLAFVIRFYNAPRLTLTILTIAVIPAVEFASVFVTALPIFPPVQDRTQEELFGQLVKLPFDDFGFTLGSFGLEFGFAHLLALGLSVAALGGLYAFFRFTRIGVAIRAAAENNERAKILGISVITLSMIAWTISGALSGLGVVLQGSIQRQFSPGAIPPQLIIISLAAAAIARFERYPVAVLAAVLLTGLREAIRFSYETQTALIDVGLFVIILGAFLLMRQRGQRAEEAEATAFESAGEPRPIPREMLALTSVVFARRAFVALLAIGLVVFPLAATPGQTNEAGYLILVAITFLSLVVLTGWAGQASLGQFAFVAVAAVVGGSLTARAGITFWIALIVVPLFTAMSSSLMGFPALRIRGLFLAVATFAFAIGVESVLFQERYFGWLLPGAIERPQLFFIDLEDTRSMYYFNLIFLAFAVFVVVVLRRSRTGRVLIALRENENNLRSFGVNPMRMRLAAFAISGFLCGLAGVLLAHQQRAATAADFPARLSLDIFLFAVVGGVGSVTGALLGALYFSLQRLLTNQFWQFVIGPFGVLIVLYIAPGGLASIVTSLRDGVLKIIAQRRQMVVPALFSDIDAAAVENQLIPLAEVISEEGLGALPHEQRYRSGSDLYGARGRPAKGGDRKRGEEAVALGAAVDALGGED